MLLFSTLLEINDTRTLDLNRDFADISADLNAIVAAHFGIETMGGK